MRLKIERESGPCIDQNALEIIFAAGIQQTGRDQYVNQNHWWSVSSGNARHGI